MFSLKVLGTCLDHKLHAPIMLQQWQMASPHPRLWSQLSPGASPEPCAVISAGGVLDLCYADEEALGGGAGAVARFLGHLFARCCWFSQVFPNHFRMGFLAVRMEHRGNLTNQQCRLIIISHRLWHGKFSLLMDKFMGKSWNETGYGFWNQAQFIDV